MIEDAAWFFLGMIVYHSFKPLCIRFARGVWHRMTRGT